MSDPPGVLTLVATPIGNLGDLPPRAVDVLAAAAVVACEDTRHTGRLLAHAGVRARRLVAVHEHNEREQVPALLAVLAAGDDVALVSDAGMPAISDPGERLVAAAAAAGFRVQAVPGPSAVVTAVAVSGLAAGRFCFEGFLPRKGPERRRRLAVIAADERTTAVYEAPPRVPATLRDLAGACGPERPVAVCRELTKLFEEVWRGTLGPAAEHWEQAERRGEFVLVIGGAVRAEAGLDEVDAALAAQLAQGADPRSAVRTVAAALGVPRRVVYDRVLARKG